MQNDNDLSRLGSHAIIARASAAKIAIPAFNVPYIPMMKPIVDAVRDCNAFAFVDVARLEWIKFEAGGPEEIKREFDRLAEPSHVRLHLDHVPVIDEDGERVDFLPIIEQALSLGYDSVMVDGSRLTLEENIAATAAVCERAHAAGVPAEGELGAILGHEAGPLPPYEELFASGRGFTDVEEAARFVEETKVDWLSVAVGNIHGAIAPGIRAHEKPQARLAIDHLKRIAERTNVPLVLHGGSGIKLDNVLAGIETGIAKINIATDLRRPYEALRDTDHEAALQAVYDATVESCRRLRLVDSVEALAAVGAGKGGRE